MCTLQFEADITLNIMIIQPSSLGCNALNIMIIQHSGV